MGSAETIYAARFAGPELVERGRLNRLSCPVYRDGVLVAPDEGTVTVRRRDGTTVVSAAVEVVSSVATYEMLAATLVSEQLGEGWSIEWALLIDELVYTFRREMALCRRSLYPVLTDADLVRRHSDLSDLRPRSMTSYQTYLDEAWVELLHRLRQGGSLAQLVCSPEDLRYVHMFRALEIIFRDFMVSSSADSKWSFLAQSYAEQFKTAWGQLSLKYDSDEDGIADEQRRPMTAVTFLCADGHDPYGYAQHPYTPRSW